MQRYVTDIRDPELSNLFATSGHLCRINSLQTYRVPVEAELWAAWRRGDTDAPARAQEPWCTRVVAPAVAAGRRMERVHVAHTPLTSYLRFALECYGHNVAAGEQIKLLTVAPGRWPHGVPRWDFWMFDQRVVADMQFDSQGRWEGLYLTDDSSTVERAQRAWRTAWAHPQGRLLNALPVAYRG